MLGNKNFGFLVESVNLLHHLISRYRNLSSSFARQIAKTSQQTQPNLSIIRTVIGFQIPPQFFLLLKTLIRLRLNQENTGYRHDHDQHMSHITSLVTVKILYLSHIIDHQLIYTDLLIHTTDHHALTNGLICSSDKVAVKVNAKDEKTITFDANHEMAGKELNFEIELVEVK